jgi:8-oxo-dGTP diphosphatase
MRKGREHSRPFLFVRYFCVTSHVILSAAEDLMLVAGGGELLRFAGRQKTVAIHPLSIKGILIHDGSVLLLRNERGEWELPGGRPDPGEDHRVALKRELWEETGLDVEVRALVDQHLFEVLPDLFVQIVVYACVLTGASAVTLSHEHLEMRWVPLAELGETIGGHRLPAGYLGAIRQAMSQPRAPSDRMV